MTKDKSRPERPAWTSFAPRGLSCVCTARESIVRSLCRSFRPANNHTAPAPGPPLADSLQPGLSHGGPWALGIRRNLLLFRRQPRDDLACPKRVSRSGPPALLPGTARTRNERNGFGAAIRG